MELRPGSAFRYGLYRWQIALSKFKISGIVSAHGKPTAEILAELLDSGHCISQTRGRAADSPFSPRVIGGSLNNTSLNPTSMRLA
jgi:hypothetical protein